MLMVSKQSRTQRENGRKRMLMCLIGLIIVLISLAGGNSAAIR